MARKTRVKWEPSPEDMGRVLDEQNPWHRSGSVPDVFAKPTERTLGQNLWRKLLRADPHRYQVILGPRRVGKTTVMYQTVKHLLESGVAANRLWWFRLDHPLLMRWPLGGLVESLIKINNISHADPAYLFFDELVYSNEWDLWLKSFYDGRYPIRVVATSSATAALREGRLESGVGRWEEQYLMPYSFTEFLDLVNLGSALPIGPTLPDTIESLIASPPAPELLQHVGDMRRLYVLTGGFPELLLSLVKKDADGETSNEMTRLLESQRILRTDAVERAVYKDIPQAFSVDQPMLLERLLYVIAGQFTGLLSPTNICKEMTGISQATFDRYLSYLERAFLIFMLPNYSGREISIQKRGRKVFFVDGAIRNAALQRGLAPLTNTIEMGYLLENLAASQLQGLATQSQVRLFHWRDGNNEVDLIYNHPEYPLAFEIASSADHSRGGLLKLMERDKRLRGRCYIVSQDGSALHPKNTSSGVGVLPVDLFLLAVGRQAEAALRFRLFEPSTSEREQQLPLISPSASPPPSER